MLGAIGILGLGSIIVFKHLLLLCLELWIIRKLSHDLLLLVRSLLRIWLCLLPEVRRRDHFLSLWLRRILGLTLRAGRLVRCPRPLVGHVAL